MSAWEGNKRSIVLAVLCLGACAGPGSRIVQRGAFERTPSLTADSITAPVRGDGLGELATLQRLPPTPANQLRRAYILLETGDRAGAVVVVNRLLYGEEPPTAAAEALARYLRARAGRDSVPADEVAADARRARELAEDPGLRALLASEFPEGDAPKPAAAPAVAATTQRPRVLPRSAWGARSAERADLLPLGKPSCITIHHSTILLDSYSAKVAAAQLVQIQADHQHANGWADIGYHFVIDRGGRIWEGRELRWQGAHAGGQANRGNIGICLLGRFLRGPDGQEPSREQAAALEQVLRWLCQTYDLPTSSIYFHRRFKATECPGPRLEAVVNDIRRRMDRPEQT